MRHWLIARENRQEYTPVVPERERKRKTTRRHRYKRENWEKTARETSERGGFEGGGAECEAEGEKNDKL
jgi:hypothetical protein